MMTPIEIIIVIMLSLMVVPDVCRRWGRPSIAVVAYVLIGLLLGPVLNKQAGLILQEVGRFGFVLLLFEIGLEIDVQRQTRMDMRAAFSFVWKWVCCQYPVVLILAKVAGLAWPQAMLAGCALTACSIGLVLPVLGRLEGVGAVRRDVWLRRMVLLEILAVVTLSAGDVLLLHGIGWQLVLQVAGMGVAIYLVGKVARHVTPHLRWLLDRMIHWRVHLIVLFVLLVSALGERLGLSAPKTAFFLGLFMNRATHEGLALDRHLAPVSQRLLIPVFLVSLGGMIPLPMLFSLTGVMALCSAVFLMGFRLMIGKRLDHGAIPEGTIWLLGPNLTMVAIAVHSLHKAGASGDTMGWVMLCGLFLSLLSLLMLPRGAAGEDRV